MGHLVEKHHTGTPTVSSPCQLISKGGNFVLALQGARSLPRCFLRVGRTTGSKSATIGDPRTVLRKGSKEIPESAEPGSGTEKSTFRHTPCGGRTAAAAAGSLSGMRGVSQGDPSPPEPGKRSSFGNSSLLSLLQGADCGAVPPVAAASQQPPSPACATTPTTRGTARRRPPSPKARERPGKQQRRPPLPAHPSPRWPRDGGP